MSCQCVRCEACNGSGHVWVENLLGDDDLEQCEDCDGRGLTEECDECADERERRDAEEWIYE